MNFALFLIYGNEYGDRRSGSFQATVTTFGTTTIGWGAERHVSKRAQRKLTFLAMLPLPPTKIRPIPFHLQSELLWHRGAAHLQ